MAKPNKKGKSPNSKGPASQGRKSFDENALSQLTSKIDQSLNTGGGNDHKRKKPPTNESANQDRKRQRNSSNGPAPKSAVKGDKGEKSDKAEIAALLEEIRALGGDEKDLELIQDIDSDDEDLVKDTSKQPVDKGLKAELAALSKELGFAEYQPSEASDDDDDQDGDAGEDDEDDQVEDDEDEDEEDEDAEEEDKHEAPRKIGNMVSILYAFVTPLTTNQ